jgi:hypothetical protein
MDTEPLDSGPVGPSDTTADMAAVTNEETEDEGHEPCYLFSNETEHYIIGTNIKKLQLGVAAACQNCSLVLDAVTTYSSERLCMDSITEVTVLQDCSHIWIDNDERERIDLGLFRLEGKLYTCRFVCFQWL